MNDFGRIEFSPDNGISWIDLINDTINTPIWGEKPVLTGHSDWTYFSANLAYMGFDIELGDYVEGIEHSRMNDFNSNIYPNPGNQLMTIEFENNNLHSVLLEVFDDTGRLIFRGSGEEQGDFRVNVSSFQSGAYFYRLVDHTSNRVSHGKFIAR